ncbi:hypothetical protein DFH08DRAFT_1012373 [Mycena albidolilacea]|uniref:Uncharacterized protein n=1 Tax=Mycena albidolilacea TaxID=1033008 RepID=A0AAD7EPF2_9AGAR|nr:hypothetical protein DFH08DRAFT_1012373 [Mycena albidolilacea]
MYETFILPLTSKFALQVAALPTRLLSRESLTTSQCISTVWYIIGLDRDTYARGGENYALGDFAVRQTVIALVKGEADVTSYAHCSMSLVNIWDARVTSDGLSAFVQRRYPNGTFRVQPTEYAQPGISDASRRPSLCWQAVRRAQFIILHWVHIRIPQRMSSNAPRVAYRVGKQKGGQRCYDSFL